LRYHRAEGHDEKKFAVPVMQAINKLLAAMHPLPSQSGGYGTQVVLFVGIIRKELGSKFQKTHKNALQFAGGSESQQDRKAHLVMNQSKASDQRLNNHLNLIPIHQRNVTLAVWKWMESDDPLQMLLGIEQLCYARKNEIINPRVSMFSQGHRDGYIFQDGVSKQKKKYDDDDNLIVPEKRAFNKPIVMIPKKDKPSEIYTVDDILAKIDQLRQILGVEEKISAGWSKERIATIFQSKDLSREVQLMFPEATVYSKAHGRKNGLSTHFLRKGGMRVAFDQHGLPNESFTGFIARYGGWDAASGLETSISYGDTKYIPLLKDLKQLEQIEFERVDVLRRAEKEVAEIKQKCVEPTIAETDVTTGPNNWRAVVRDGKKKKRKFITLTNGPEKKQKILYSRRVGVTPEQKQKNLRRVAEQLALLDVSPVTGGMLKLFGYGSGTIKKAAL
jgi:hypothetical protein